MRTTVEFDADTGRAVEELRKQGMGVSEAVNELIRRGMVPRTRAGRSGSGQHRSG